MTKPAATSALDHALEYLAAGLSVVPIRPDGSKAPALKEWKPLERARMSEEEARKVFRPGLGVAVIGGAISGGLEVIDIDSEEIMTAWLPMVPLALLDRLPQVRTPRGGLHVYLRVATAAPTTKLAQRPNPEATSKQKVVTLIDLKAEGGYVLAPGCPSTCD